LCPFSIWLKLKLGIKFPVRKVKLRGTHIASGVPLTKRKLGFLPIPTFSLVPLVSVKTGTSKQEYACEIASRVGCQLSKESCLESDVDSTDSYSNVST
jgi:hypothetical protein